MSYSGKTDEYVISAGRVHMAAAQGTAPRSVAHGPGTPVPPARFRNRAWSSAGRRTGCSVPEGPLDTPLLATQASRLPRVAPTFPAPGEPQPAHPASREPDRPPPLPVRLQAGQLSGMTMPVRGT